MPFVFWICGQMQAGLFSSLMTLNDVALVALISLIGLVASVNVSAPLADLADKLVALSLILNLDWKYSCDTVVS